MAGNGTVLLVVDQPSTIGAVAEASAVAVAEASAVAVAQAEGVMVGYIPGLAMRSIADLHPGEASTAAREAAIIAGAARSMSHTLRSIVFADEQAAEPSMVCGFDDDLAKQATATSSRLRGLPT
ncbi:transposase [Arthrobacter sp. PAMC 25486]|nr:transposase [Arthrobacter sp. PAMC 25486]